MRTIFGLTAVAGALALGGCTTWDQYGYSNRYDPYGGGYYGMGGPSFQEAAVETCTYQARRYGGVRIASVQPVGRDTMRVYGTVQFNNSHATRPFACSFRADGRITGFDID